RSERQCAGVQGIRRRQPDFRALDPDWTQMTTTRQIAWFEGAVCASMFLGALAFQYIGHYPPCEMCHWQRWPHIAAAAIGLGGTILIGAGMRRGLWRPRRLPCGRRMASVERPGRLYDGLSIQWWTARPERTRADVRPCRLAAVRGFAGRLQRGDLAGCRGVRRHPIGTQDMRRKPRPTFPGTRTSDEVAAMIRVDHAGEYGAVRIYEGQMAVLGGAKSATADAIRHMAEQEQRHLKAFDALVNARRVRPTALEPVWRAAG